MQKPQLLDLFCGGGLAALGYINAGFEVTGVDLITSKNYPGQLIISDAIEFAKRNAHQFDIIHASPPCQEYSKLKAFNRHHSSIPLNQLREILETSKSSYIIENVPGAPLINYIKLNGSMFGLKCLKERWFESNMLLFAPEKIPTKGKFQVNKYGLNKNGFTTIAGNMFSVKYVRNMLQLPGQHTRREIAEGIPPIYTHYLGLQIFDLLTNKMKLKSQLHDSNTPAISSIFY